MPNRGILKKGPEVQREMSPDSAIDVRESESRPHGNATASGMKKVRFAEEMRVFVYGRRMRFRWERAEWWLGLLGERASDAGEDREEVGILREREDGGYGKRYRVRGKKGRIQAKTRWRRRRRSS
jgi:hypothetical protein